MSRVFVLDKNKQPLCPCHPARARWLLNNKRAAVFRRYPFTIIMKDRLVIDSVVKEHRIKLDPGSKVTGLAVVQEDKKVVFAAEIEHRGWLVKKRMDDRRIVRQSRRNRKTRYRQARFLNRTGKWRRKYAPSLESRMANVLTWVNRLRKFCPISTVSVEIAKFDTQKMQNPEIKGIEYQQGTLQGYEVKQYLLEKWNYKCAYCNKGNCPLQIEHILARSRSGSDRVSNLVVSCKKCNDRKGTKSIDEFLKNKPELLKKIKSQLKQSLTDSEAVNITRKEVHRRLCLLGLPVEIGYGYQTKWNREQLGLPKEHWIDAACIKNKFTKRLKGINPLKIEAKGLGNRQMSSTNKYGFPINHRAKQKAYKGFRTGDICWVIADGRNKGYRFGKIRIRNKGNWFSLGEKDVRINLLNRVHRADGYNYK